MIQTTVNDLSRYESLNPLFPAAFSASAPLSNTVFTNFAASALEMGFSVFPQDCGEFVHTFRGSFGGEKGGFIAVLGEFL
jgi:hypothetical protein